MTSAPPPRKSDLGARTASAMVMALVAGAALWAGGITFTVFVALLALAIYVEWVRLVMAFAHKWPAQLAWLVAGLSYIGVAALTLDAQRQIGPHAVLHVVLGVIAVDIGAYFAGRLIGGPRIAPRISPSKTWAGLGGGMLLVALLYAGFVLLDFASVLQAHPGYAASQIREPLRFALIEAALVALVAQAGDFFESWMKRRAGVKDSGSWLPGHGGFFDRLDGLLAVLFLRGAWSSWVVASQRNPADGLFATLAGMWQIFLRAHGAP